MAHIVMVLIGNIRYDGRVRKEIGTLVAAGHQVELIVSDFGTNGASAEDLGIRFHHVPMTLWCDPLRNFWEQVAFNRTAASIIKALRPSHIHCHDLSSLLAGVWAKKTTRAKLIFDAHELTPESWKGIRQTIWDCIERHCIASCDQILMPEKHRISYFKGKYPYISEPWLLENFPRKGEIQSAPRNVFRENHGIRKDQKIILYSGVIGPGRHIEDLVDSMTLCSEEFVLVIVGMSFKGYEETLRVKVNRLRLSGRVIPHGPVPHSEILRYMASCDLGTALYRNTDLNSYYCASNKLYEYIALNKVVITNNYPGLLDRVAQFQQGVCLAEVTPESLKDAYSHALCPGLVTPGKKHFFWEDQQDVLLELYEK